MNDFMFNNMNQNFSIFNIMFIVVSIIIGLGFVFVILSMVSPKFRGKMMSRQVKATKHMIDYSKEDLEDISSTAINIRKNILNENEDALRDQMTEEATNRIKHRLLLEAVVEKENIEVTDEDAEKGATDLATKYQMEKDEFLKAFGGLEMIKYDLKMRQALDILKK